MQPMCHSKVGMICTVLEAVGEELAVEFNPIA